MTDTIKIAELINLLRTFIGDTQIVRAAREAADVIEQQAARIAELERQVSGERGQKEIWEARAKEWCELATADSAMAKDAEEPSLQALYEDACISANKNAKDAERYRWLHERYIGFDFGWNADENGDNGKQVLCFEMDNGMRISADIDASIDAQTAASEPKKEPT